MERATTPATRRGLWGDDVRDLVNQFQLCARGGGRDGFPPWRIGYMAGLQEVKEAGDCFIMQMHRMEPKDAQQTVVIPKAGRPTAQLLDMLCWHYDQDVRRSELDEEDERDSWYRFPSGRMLVDPLFDLIMRDAGLDGEALANRIRDADGFAVKRTVRVRIGGGSCGGNTEIRVRRNEIHARFHLHEDDKVEWANGHLIADLGDLPEAIRIAAKGRPLRDLVRHDLIERAADIRITGITAMKDGRHMVATDAARAEGMVDAPYSVERTTA